MIALTSAPAATDVDHKRGAVECVGLIGVGVLGDLRLDTFNDEA